MDRSSIATQGDYSPALSQAYRLYVVFSWHKRAPCLSSGQVAPRKCKNLSQIEHYHCNSWQIWVSSPWLPFNEITSDYKDKKHDTVHGNGKQVLRIHVSLKHIMFLKQHLLAIKTDACGS